MALHLVAFPVVSVCVGWTHMASVSHRQNSQSSRVHEFYCECHGSSLNTRQAAEQISEARGCLAASSLEIVFSHEAAKDGIE